MVTPCGGKTLSSFHAVATEHIHKKDRTLLLKNITINEIKEIQLLSLAVNFQSQHKTPEQIFSRNLALILGSQ